MVAERLWPDWRSLFKSGFLCVLYSPGHTLSLVEEQITIQSRATGQSILSDTKPLEMGEYDIFHSRGKLYEL